MRIGIAVSNLTFDWPVRIAEDYAMVDVLSGGRLDFGVGRGYQPQEFHNMGVGDIQGESREVFVEALEIIRGLWSKPVGEPFSFHGRHFDIDKIDCGPPRYSARPRRSTSPRSVPRPSTWLPTRATTCWSPPR